VNPPPVIVDVIVVVSSFAAVTAAKVGGVASKVQWKTVRETSYYGAAVTMLYPGLCTCTSSKNWYKFASAGLVVEYCIVFPVKLALVNVLEAVTGYPQFGVWVAEKE